MNLISIILTAGITSGIITALLNWYLKQKEVGEQRRWEIKREACLEALQIVDARFADYDWNANGSKLKVDPQGFVATADIRSCYNRLVLACRDSSVPRLFEKCLDLQVIGKDYQPLIMGEVTELRNAVRKELGFGKDLKTEISWITFINWRHAKKKRR